MCRNKYLLSFFSEKEDEDVLEIFAYSEEQAWHYAYEIVPAENIISMEYCGIIQRQQKEHF